MPHFQPCWTEENAGQVLETEALGGSDAVFLATHTPIVGFSVKGSQASELRECTEDAVLLVLSAPARRHAFCIVHGEPGSGKSHLIKWLDTKWPKAPQDVVLLIRRANGSLQGTLEQLAAKLGSDFSDLFHDLQPVSKVSDAGRAKTFLSRLADALDPDYYQKSPDDAEWCKIYLPETILNLPIIRENWAAPTKILRLIDGGGSEGRNSKSATFDVYDILDLVHAGRAGVIGSGVRGGPEKLWRKLREESELLEEFQKNAWLAQDVESHEGARVPYTIKLAAALNLRRNEAVQGVMGISPAGLKKLFSSVRERLQTKNKRLVLLLEDITSFEGIDDSLIDVLIDDQGTQDNASGNLQCPIISVVGVTPKYYQSLQGNYRQRATHEVIMGEDSGGLQDVALLRAPETRAKFIVRYLAAARVGVKALEKWIDEDAEASIPPPNKCSSCPLRDDCFNRFGEVDGIGTFPFTPFAFERFFEALKLDDDGQTWRTPRGIIQAVLGPSLRGADRLRDGSFPDSNLLATSGLSDDALPDNVVSFDLKRALNVKLEGDADGAARLARLISFWGNPGSSDTTLIDGEMSFAGVRKSIFNAFAAPWIGEETPTQKMSANPALADTASTPIPTDTQADSDLDQDLNAREDDADPVSPRTQTHVNRGGTQTTPRVPSNPRKGATKTELVRLREDLNGWSNGDRPKEGQLWNKFLFDIISGFDLRRFGVSPGLLFEVLNASRVKIAGSSASSRTNFELERENWVVGGLEKYLLLRSGSFESANQWETGLRDLARFTRKLEKAVADYVLSSIPKLDEGADWNPVSTLTDVLFSRAILRGDVPEGASTVDCVRIILSDPPESRGDRAARSKAWKEFCEATDASDKNLRAQLRVHLNMEGRVRHDELSGMIDASLVVTSITRMRETCNFGPVPASEFKAANSLEKARTFVNQWSSNWVSLFSQELRMLEGRAETIENLIGTDAVIAHLDRVDAAISKASEALLEVSPEKVGQWKSAIEKLKVTVDAEGEADLIKVLDSFERDESEGPESRIDRYCRVARFPVLNLEAIWTNLKAGHDLVGEFVEHAKDRIEESENAPDAALLTETASVLRAIDASHRKLNGAAA